jgi:hypothetical protein
MKKAYTIQIQAGCQIIERKRAVTMKW